MLVEKFNLGTLQMNNGSQLQIGTFHLESEAQETSLRAKQFGFICEISMHLPLFIFCGVTNFVSEEEEDISKTNIRDAWSALQQISGQKSPGYTFDTEENKMCCEEYTEKANKRNRIDRCYYSADTLEPISIEIIGKDAYNLKEWISDHFGLFVVFKIKS